MCGMQNGLKVGLALGGGGAKGLAHLGVLKVLEKSGIRFDYIAGTSFGAIAGAMYAQSPDMETIGPRIRAVLTSGAFRRTQLFIIKRHYEEKKRTNFISSIRSYIETELFFGISLRRSSFIRETDFVSHINALLEDLGIEEAVIPFVSVATDLTQGREVILSAGSIRKAVAASCAIPGVFPPITIGDLSLIDGGWVNPVPVSPVREMGADFVIAVDTAEDNESRRVYKTGLEIVLRGSEITRRLLSKINLEGADFVIRPKIDDIHWADFQRYEEVVQRGESAAMDSIDLLKQRLSERGIS